MQCKLRGRDKAARRDLPQPERRAQRRAPLCGGEAAGHGTMPPEVHPGPQQPRLRGIQGESKTLALAKVNGRPGEEKNFYHQFSIEKYSSLPRDTFKTYVERHVTRRKLSLKLIGYCRQSSYTDSEVVFTLLPAVAWVLKSQFAPGYMHFNKCFEGVSGKRGIFHNGKLAIEVFFLSRPAIDFS